MLCPHCGSIIEKQAKFCGECGVYVNQSGAQPAVQRSASVVAVQKNSGEYIQKGKEVGRRFYSFALTAAAAPMNASRKVIEADYLNGLIANLLLAFLLPLFSYFTARSLNNGWMEVDIPFGQVVIQPFFYILIFMAVFTVINFAAAKLMKTKVTFKEVVTRYGVFNVLPLGLVTLAVVFALLSATVFSTFLFGVGAGLFALSSLFLIFSLKENSDGGLDVYYALLLVNFVMFLVFAMFGINLVKHILEQLSYWPFSF